MLSFVRPSTETNILKARKKIKKMPKFECWIIYFPEEKRFFHSYNSKVKSILKATELKNGFFIFDEKELPLYQICLNKWILKDEKFIFIKLEGATDK